jgi:hypothetical protein
MDGPVRRDSEREDNANGAGFNDGGESFVVIDAVFLRKPTDDPPSFIASKGAIGMKLVAKNPFARDYIGAGGTRDELPSGVVEESGEFRAHGG